MDRICNFTFQYRYAVMLLLNNYHLEKKKKKYAYTHTPLLALSEIFQPSAAEAERRTCCPIR